MERCGAVRYGGRKARYQGRSGTKPGKVCVPCGVQLRYFVNVFLWVWTRGVGKSKDEDEVEGGKDVGRPRAAGGRVGTGAEQAGWRETDRHARRTPDAQGPGPRTQMGGW